MNNQENIYTDADLRVRDRKLKMSDKLRLPLLCAAYLLLTLYLPVVLFFDIPMIALQGISVASALISLFAFAILSRRPRLAVSYALTLVLSFVLLGILLCGMLASLIGSILILAYLLITQKRFAFKLAWLLPALVSYLGASALLGSFALSAIALFHLPAAILLAYSFGRGQDRISVICKTSAGIVLSIAAVAAAVYISRYGTNFSIIAQVADSARNYLTNILSQMLYTVYNEIAELSMTDATTLATAAVTATFNLLPAIIVIVSNILAFYLQSMMINIFIHDEEDKEKRRNMTLFDMSVVSAVIFLIAFFASLILSRNEVSVWSVTADNISLILMPGLVLTAILALRRFTFGKKGSCGGVLIYFAIIFLIFYLPSIMLTIASIAGATVIILNSITQKMHNKKNKDK
ncbi:MAG: DUF2232 domain-containing protein [Clostridia bacterium]|nr:DUF2232 domain-containing protein [Clostridia bacterium]